MKIPIVAFDSLIDLGAKFEIRSGGMRTIEFEFRVSIFRAPFERIVRSVWTVGLFSCSLASDQTDVFAKLLARRSDVATPEKMKTRLARRLLRHASQQQKTGNLSKISRGNLGGYENRSASLAYNRCVCASMENAIRTGVRPHSLIGLRTNRPKAKPELMSPNACREFLTCSASCCAATLKKRTFSVYGE